MMDGSSESIPIPDSESNPPPDSVTGELPETKPCVFCGKANDFLMFCRGVCLTCGDRLQAEHSLMLSTLEQYQSGQKRLEQMGAEVLRLLGAIERGGMEIVACIGCKEPLVCFRDGGAPICDPCLELARQSFNKKAVAR